MACSFSSRSLERPTDSGLTGVMSMAADGAPCCARVEIKPRARIMAVSRLERRTADAGFIKGSLLRFAFFEHFARDPLYQKCASCRWRLFSRSDIETNPWRGEFREAAATARCPYLCSRAFFHRRPAKAERTR